MTEQLDLEFRKPHPSTDAEVLVGALWFVPDAARGRASAEWLAEHLQWRTRRGDPDLRRVRAAASASNGMVVSAPGRPYVHAHRIPVDEYMHDYRTPFRSQIKDMLRRETKMTRAVHSGGRLEDVK